MKLEEVKKGLVVIYWGIMKDGGEKFNPLKTRITSEAWPLGHEQLVCKVHGISGGVSIKHLELATDENVAAAKTHKNYKEV